MMETIEPEVVECVEYLVSTVEKKLRRVSFSTCSKSVDGIVNRRDAVLVYWFRINYKQDWRGGFDYSTLTNEELYHLKVDTENLVHRLYQHPQKHITILSNGAGGTLPTITLTYFVFKMANEVHYLHTIPNVKSIWTRDDM